MNTKADVEAEDTRQLSQKLPAAFCESFHHETHETET